MLGPPQRTIDRPETIARAQAATRALEALVVSHLVTTCPRPLKYAIEGSVEDCPGGAPFDVVYLDEITPAMIARFEDGAVHARDLR